MMRGATGKGLEIKGKSAKTGILSGFVPMLQISEERHKHHVARSPKNARIRVYFRSEPLREAALTHLNMVMMDMRKKLASSEAVLRQRPEASEEDKEAAMQITT